MNRFRLLRLTIIESRHGEVGKKSKMHRTGILKKPARPSVTAAVTVFLCLAVALGTCAKAGAEIPTSQRAREAVARVAPQLKQALARAGLAYGAPIFIRLFKQEKQLELWVRQGHRFVLFKTYPVCTYGGRGLGPKTQQGDGKAPEGFYYVAPAALNPLSKFHLSFNLGYPNRYDRTHGRTGGALMIHGDCVSIGCYAMTDRAIEEIFTLADAAFRNGQRFFRVHIFPFRMTDANMEGYGRSPWRSFWKNLKEGYDFFERNGHIPPNVEVKDRRYIFNETRRASGG